MKMMTKKASTAGRQGFTLVELIVTVTIIALITAMVALSFGGTNRKARDSRRAADLEKVRVALEMYKQAMSTYPTASGGQPQNLTPTYIQTLPTDPKSPGVYYYAQTNGGYGYTLNAMMEDPSNGNGTFGNNCGGSCNYQVTNP